MRSSSESSPSRSSGSSHTNAASFSIAGIPPRFSATCDMKPPFGSLPYYRPPDGWGANSRGIGGIGLGSIAFPAAAIGACKIKTPPTSGGALQAFENVRLDRHLQVFGGAERHFLAGLDLDRFPGHRVAAHAGGALAHDQDTEARDLHPLAFFQVLGNHADQVFHHFETLLLGELMLLSEGGGQMLGGDRLASLRLGWSGCCHRETPWERA